MNNNGQQWTTIRGATCISDAVYWLKKTWMKFGATGVWVCQIKAEWRVVGGGSYFKCEQG